MPLPSLTPCPGRKRWLVLVFQGKDKAEAGGLRARAPLGAACPRVPSFCLRHPQVLAGLPEGHRLAYKHGPDLTLHPQSDSVKKLNTALLKFLFENANTPGRAASESLCKLLRNRGGVSRPDPPGLGSLFPFLVEPTVPQSSPLWLRSQDVMAHGMADRPRAGGSEAAVS